MTDSEKLIYKVYQEEFLRDLMSSRTDMPRVSAFVRTAERTGVTAKRVTQVWHSYVTSGAR